MRRQSIQEEEEDPESLPSSQKVNIQGELRDHDVHSDYYSGNEEINEAYSSDEQDKLGNRGVTASVSKPASRKKPTSSQKNKRQDDLRGREVDSDY